MLKSEGVNIFRMKIGIIYSFFNFSVVLEVLWENKFGDYLVFVVYM